MTTAASATFAELLSGCAHASIEVVALARRLVPAHQALEQAIAEALEGAGD